MPYWGSCIVFKTKEEEKCLFLDIITLSQTIKKHLVKQLLKIIFALKLDFMRYDTCIHLSTRIYLCTSMKHNFYLFQRRRARVGVHGNHRYAR